MNRLTDCRPGSFLQVQQISAENDDAIRLKRLGICEGREIQVIQLGDPLILRVVGARIGINRRLAEMIDVTAIEQQNSKRIPTDSNSPESVNPSE